MSELTTPSPQRHAHPPLLSMVADAQSWTVLGRSSGRAEHTANSEPLMPEPSAHTRAPDA